MSTVERWHDLPGYEGVFSVSSHGRVKALGRRPSKVSWTPIDGERWLPIEGYEGIYEVSDHGRIKSLERIDGRGHWKMETLLSPGLAGPEGKQYRSLQLSRDGKAVNRKVHHLVLESFVGPRPEGMEACHGVGGREDNRLVNLRWDTPSGNNQDKKLHGTHNLNKTHCPRGHEYTPDNIYVTNGTGRACKTCALDRARNQEAPKNPRTHCRKGHEMTPDNISWSGSGRKCRTCYNARMRARYAAKRAKS